MAATDLRKRTFTDDYTGEPIQIKRQNSFTTNFENVLQVKSASPCGALKRPEFEIQQESVKNANKKDLGARNPEDKIAVRPETPPPSPSKENGRETARQEDQTDGFCHMIRDSVCHLKHDVDHLTEEIANGVKDLFHKLPTSCMTHQESIDEDYSTEVHEHVGNNVHLPSPFPSDYPYRLGVHIERATPGFRIARLFKNTIAHKASLRESDIITHLNDVDLREKNLIEVLQMFGKVEKTFILTILREVCNGDKTELNKLTVKITITVDTVNKTFEIDVIVWSPTYWHIGWNSGKQYITQDDDHESQVYMYPGPDDSLCMGGVTDDRAIFVFELYYPLPTDGGQICLIRNTSTDKVIDSSTNKLIPMSNESPSNSCLFYKYNLSDGAYVFESIMHEGHYLINDSRRILLTRYTDISIVPPSGKFVLYNPQ